MSMTPEQLAAFRAAIYGEVRTGDDAIRGPMPLLGIVVGAWLLALGATGWAVGRLWGKRNG